MAALLSKTVADLFWLQVDTFPSRRRLANHAAEIVPRGVQLRAHDRGQPSSGGYLCFFHLDRVVRHRRLFPGLQPRLSRIQGGCVQAEIGFRRRRLPGGSHRLHQLRAIFRVRELELEL